MRRPLKSCRIGLTEMSAKGWEIQSYPTGCFVLCPGGEVDCFFYFLEERLGAEEAGHKEGPSDLSKHDRLRL